jgi:FkbM family methyltransferase
MPNAARKLWKKALQPMLRQAGVDVQRYPQKPPPDWTEHAFEKCLPASALGQVPPLSAAEDFVVFCIRHADDSKSQLLQDLFVRWRLDNKVGGFFVEFGATNGVDLSNTYSLEKQLAWKGILAEPAKCWHDRLAQNRQCAIDTRCVWETSGATLTFNEVEMAELSTVQSFSQGDQHSAIREKGKTYDVHTISLNDLLAEHNAPGVIDFLSIDTEGSELLILKSLNADRYRFNIITVEHNFTPQRELIFELLTSRGYTRVFSQLSRWDDWYVHEGLASPARQ